jgi:hypothetical protein
VGRTLALLVGLVGGVALAGIGMAILIPLIPAAARSQGLVWSASAALVALCVAAACLLSRPRRE